MRKLLALSILVALTTVIPGTAHAVPARCQPLTGDARADCLWADIDARINSGSTPATPSPTTPAPPSTGPTSMPPAGGWLSGASGTEAATGTFGTWRGSPVEIIGTWLNDPAVYPFGPSISGCGDCGRLRDWRGAVDVGISPATWRGWQSEASGGNDTFWRSTARNLRAARVGDATTYIRPYYEFNGDWFPYSVAKGQETLFKQAWERTASIIRAEFPEAKVLLGVAASGGGNRIKISDAYPATPDGLSIDFYNEWPFCTTHACFDQKIRHGAGPHNSLEPLQQLALSKGDPIIISEWGNAGRVRPASAGGGGEAPVFMEALHAWLSRHAGPGPGQVTAEVYFNIGNYDARFELYLREQVTPVMPRSAARYRELFRTN
jgi:hypothetical protein